MEHVCLCAVINCALTTPIMSLNNLILPLNHTRTIYGSLFSVYTWWSQKVCDYLPVWASHSWQACCTLVHSFPFTVTYLPVWKSPYMPFLATFWSTALITFSSLLLILVSFQKETLQHVHCHVKQPCFPVTKGEGIHRG